MQNMIIGGALVTLGLLVIAQRRSVAGDGVSLAGIATDFEQSLDGGARPATPAPSATQAHARDRRRGDNARGAIPGNGANAAALDGDAGGDSLATLLAGLPSDDAGAASTSTPPVATPADAGAVATPAAAAGADAGRRERDGGHH